MGSPGIIIFLDYEDTFDTVTWNYIQSVLNIMTFGPMLKNWVNTFASDGFTTPFFQLHRGVRQGCPLSGCLFALALEPQRMQLGTMIRLKV